MNNSTISSRDGIPLKRRVIRRAYDKPIPNISRAFMPAKNGSLVKKFVDTIGLNSKKKQRT